MSDVERNFPEWHLMSETFPTLLCYRIDSSETDEATGKERRKKQEYYPITEVQHVGLKVHTQETQRGEN